MADTTSAPAAQRPDEDQQPAGHSTHAQDDESVAPSWRRMPQKTQLVLLTMARLVEALAGGSRQSFIIFQLRSFLQADGSEPSTAVVALQLSLLKAVSAMPQLFTSTLWGVLADHPRVGHKTVIVLGLLISATSSIGMAFTRSFSGAVAWQLFSGMAAGKKAVLRSKIREISGAKFESRGVLLLPVAFNAGSILGPLLGGFLAEVRVDGYWPFLVPYAVNAVLKLSCAATIGLWLQGARPGTVKKSKKKKRVSLVPNWVQQLYRRYFKTRSKYELIPNQEYELEDGESRHGTVTGKEKQQTISIWTLRLLLTLAARALVTMHIFSYPSLMLIFVSTPRYSPVEDGNTRNSAALAERSFHTKSSGNTSSPFVHVPDGYHAHAPFVFTGGLAFKSRDLATVLAIRGVVSCLLQLVFFPRLCKVVGKLRLYRYSLLVFPITYFAAPYLVTIPSSTTAPLPAAGIALWATLLSILAVQSTARSMALPAGAMLLNAACPDASVLATVNGIGASVAAGARGIGHLLVTGWLYGVGLEAGVVGVAWWAMSIIATMAAIAAACVPEPPAEEPIAEEM